MIKKKKKDLAHEAGLANHSRRARCPWSLSAGQDAGKLGRRGAVERELFNDNLLVRIPLIVEMILVDRPCAMGV